MAGAEMKRIENIGQMIAQLHTEREALFESLAARSICHTCRFRSRPRAGVIPNCRDVENANYARRVIDVVTCRRPVRERAHGSA